MSGQGPSNQNKKNHRKGQQKQEVGKQNNENSVQKLLSALQNAQSKTEVAIQAATAASASASSSTSENKKNNKKSQNKKHVTIQDSQVHNHNHNQNVNVYSVEKPAAAPAANASQAKKRKQKKSVGSRIQQQQAHVEVPTKKVRISTKPQNVPPQQQQQPIPSGYKGPRIPKDVLDDLEFRFISNIPDIEKKCHIRICFQVELAHWFYVDHIVENDERKDCPNIGIRDFTKSMFHHCRELRRLAMNVDEVIAEWRNYKSTVPTYGAILVDDSLEQVLLVQSYFSKSNNWGFPKGKVNENENPRDCAIRETYEETGFDFATLAGKEKRVQKFVNDAMVRLYIVPDVPKNFPFAPRTRKEIRKIEWFNIADLPSDKGEELPQYLSGYKFFMIIPFINDIRRFVEREKERRAKNPQKPKAAQPKEAAKTQQSQEAQNQPNIERPSILSQLFPSSDNSPSWANIPSSSQNSASSYKRMTSEELISSFRIPAPNLPNMSPSVDGLNPLATLGLCTPLRGTTNPNQFPVVAPSDACPVIEETAEHVIQRTPEFHRGLFQTSAGSGESNEKPVVGFAMPTTLQKPVVTSSHPWQNQRKSEGVEMKEEAYQGWLDSQLVNTIMHPPMNQSTSPNTPPNRGRLNHLLSKPIQPQPIIPVAATQSALGSAEAPKRSSRISLSGKSAFTAIPSKQQSSVAKSTMPPGNYNYDARSRTNSFGYDARVESRGSTITPQSMNVDEMIPVTYQVRSARNLFSSIGSPASSGIVSNHGNSTSSLAASMQELSMINKDMMSPPHRYPPYHSNYMIENQEIVALCERWRIPIKARV